MIKSFSKFLLISFYFFIFPAISFAQVSKIVFTTDSQSIKPNTPSGKITMQVQNSSGPTKTEETFYIDLVSNSQTGQFSSNASSWKSVNTITMSTGTTNRSFYYSDSTEGNFTVTATARGKTGGKWSESQNIIISNSVSENNTSNSSNSSDNTDSSEENSEVLGESTTNVSSLSAQLEIIAGNDRTTSPGSPIWFQATIKKNTTSAGPELNWSFGDGNIGVGSLVSHTYKYSGDYAVVLNARAGDIFSVSRLKVKVVESNLSISDKGEYLEITNNSGAEINLFNWKVENKGRGFIFQPNTIILPHSSIKLDKSLLNMKGYDNSLGTRLKNSLGEEVFAIAPIREINLNEASKNLEIIKKEFSMIQEKVKDLSFIPQNKNEEKQAALISSLEVATDTENIIYEAPRNEGIINRFFNFFADLFR